MKKEILGFTINCNDRGYFEVTGPELESAKTFDRYREAEEFVEGRAKVIEKKKMITLNLKVLGDDEKLYTIIGINAPFRRADSARC